jgi:hypothetical protein
MARPQRVAPPPFLPAFPAKVIRVDPANLGGIHSQTVCKCDDSVSHVMKDGTHHPFMPHAEWFCTKLASVVGIPSLPCRILEMPVNIAGVRNYVFGSRWEEGELPKNSAPWFVRVEQGTVPLAGLVTVLSWIYAFDHFVHNVDRHHRNYFARRARHEVEIFSVDYSKAWTWNKFPLPLLPFNLADPHHRTVLTQRDLAVRWRSAWLNNAEVHALLERIRLVPNGYIRYVLESEPKEWLPEPKVRSILRWWGSKKFNERIDQISRGIGSGTIGYV